MAVTTSWNYTAAASTKQPSLPDVDYSAFTELIRGPKSEFWMTNDTSPLDSPETVRIKVTNIGNIYQGSEILPSYFATSKAGREIFIQLNDILTATESTDPTYRADLPFSGYFSLKFPTNSLITADMLLAFFQRLMSMAFATGAVTKSRLEALMRGSSKPSNLG